MKIWAKTDTHPEGKFLVVRRDGTVPHWPHFVLGARDLYAPAALRAYASVVLQLQGDQEYAQSILELADDFERYREQHGGGDPEAPPHRKDEQTVIAAMRGESSVILVKPDKSNIK